MAVAADLAALRAHRCGLGHLPMSPIDKTLAGIQGQARERRDRMSMSGGQIRWDVLALLEMVEILAAELRVQRALFEKPGVARFFMLDQEKEPHETD